MRTLLTTITLLTTLTVFGQYNKNAKSQNQNNSSTNEQTILTDEHGNKITSAYFPGGMEKFYSHIHKKLKYPKDAKQKGIEGVVFVSFVVGADGIINKESVMVMKGILPSCDQEVIRVIQMSPEWVPGVSLTSGEKVATKLVLPITFKL